MISLQCLKVTYVQEKYIESITNETCQICKSTCTFTPSNEMKHQPPLNQIKANFPVNPHCQSCGMAAATAAGDLKTISNSFVK